MAIEVVELLEQLRSELEAATEAGRNSDLKFELGQVELELSVAVGREAKPGAKVKFWVVEATAEAKMSTTSTQKIKLTLQPRRTSQPGRIPEVSGSELAAEIDDSEDGLVTTRIY